jgi:hypothetical protein
MPVVVASQHVVDLTSLREDLWQLVLELVGFEGLVGAVVALCPFDSGAVPGPGLRLATARLHEQAVGGAAVGAQHGHGMRMVESGQVPEVAVLPEWIVCVVRTGDQPSAEEQRYGILTHRVEKKASALRVHGQAAYRMHGADSQCSSSRHTMVTPPQYVAHSRFPWRMPV